jgi:hypothetical protein
LDLIFVYFVQNSVLFFCKVHLDSVDRDIEGELAKTPKMVSNVQQLMFIGEFLFILFDLSIYSALCYCKFLFLLHHFLFGPISYSVLSTFSSFLVSSVGDPYPIFLGLSDPDPSFFS